MKVQQLFVYPIKSLRGISVPSAVLTHLGFPYDRRFMLLKDHGDDPNPPKGLRFENMHLSGFPMMCLFTTELTPPTEDEPESGHVTVTHYDPKTKNKRSLQVPLYPTNVDLEGEFDVNMHSSPVRGVEMAREYSDWFSECFGFNVVFVFIGPSLRPVLGNIAPNAAVKNPERIKARMNADGTSASWLKSITTTFSKDSEDDYKITFADCSSYLVASSKSCEKVSEWLPSDRGMDITKFRPNIVVEGADEAWVEDYWAQISIKPGSGKQANGNGHTNGVHSDEEDATIELTSNCLRCASLNVDYETGEFVKDEALQVLKKLQKDRRIDPGHKYSPCFGRYGFMLHSKPEVKIHVGDEVNVSKRNEARTVFKWPGIGQTKKDEIWAL